MAFGQIIKKLRTESDKTQEQLAELLNISPQAVSRWENNAAMPDISLLPPLATLFGVTIDYLLDMDAWQRDTRRAEYDEEFQDLLERSVRHGKTVLENASAEKLRRSALHHIVLSLHWLDRKEEAMDYAMREEDENRRDELLSWCLDGEELTRHNQKQLDRKLNELIYQIQAVRQFPEAYEAVENILKIMFPDGNYVFYHNTLQYHFLKKAGYLCGRQKYDEAIAALRSARYHAEEMTRLGGKTSYCYTSPLFHLLEGEKPVSDSAITDVDDFVTYLKRHSYFDPLRDREDYRELEGLA